MKCVIVLLLLWYTTVEARRNHRGKLEIDSFSVHHLYWNSSNPIFNVFTNSIRSDYSSVDAAPVMKVRLLDSLAIHCPLYRTKQFEDLAEQSLVYMVSKHGFERCLLDHTARLIAQCNNMPTSRSVVHRVFRRRKGAFGRLIPGHDYYLISTSTGSPDGLYRSNGGLCAEKNMRIKIHIEKENFEKANPIEIQPIYFTNNDNINRKVNEVNGDDEVFMTEEFNELTWKKRIIDPRIPESERKFGGKIISSLPLGAAQREYLKFSRTRQIDRPMSEKQFDDDARSMMPSFSSRESNSAWSRSPSERLRRRRPFYADNTNSVINKLNDEPWELVMDNDWQSGEKLEFTKIQEMAGNLHDDNTVEIMQLTDDSDIQRKGSSNYGDGDRFTLMFYDRPSEIVRLYPTSSASRTAVTLVILSVLILHSL